MTPLCRSDRGGQTRRSCTHDRHCFRGRGGFGREFGFITGARIDQARTDLAAEGVVQTGLVTGNARRDFCGAPITGLVDEIRVGQKGPRHADHVGASVGQNLFAHFWCVDAV